ncbi:zf-HC2 domain-containing protein [Streptomyces sp. CT34]|uniref:zf-HC2 domain-containing protein n=1 Tax=Streptomyces sp. CT34 TaxID=1553907 RepID=UPI0005BCEFD9|nr:zf-HC2 domain-containing protein [Streptomyces sp. CT34]
MLCSRIRTALSARLDGEELPPGITPRGLDGHLSDCPDCRAWDAQARALTAALDRAAARAERGGARTRTRSGGAAPSDGGASPAAGTVVPLDDTAAVEALLARVRSVPAPEAAPTAAVDAAGGRTD